MIACGTKYYGTFEPDANDTENFRVTFWKMGECLNFQPNYQHTQIGDKCLLKTV